MQKKDDNRREVGLGQSGHSCRKKHGVYAGLSVYKSGRTRAQMQKIDDGDLTTGVFREHVDGYIFVLEY